LDHHEFEAGFLLFPADENCPQLHIKENKINSLKTQRNILTNSELIVLPCFPNWPMVAISEMAAISKGPPSAPLSKLKVFQRCVMEVSLLQR